MRLGGEGDSQDQVLERAAVRSKHQVQNVVNQGINELMEELNQARDRMGTVMNSVAISLWPTA